MREREDDARRRYALNGRSAWNARAAAPLQRMHEASYIIDERIRCGRGGHPVPPSIHFGKRSNLALGHWTRIDLSVRMVPIRTNSSISRATNDM